MSLINASGSCDPACAGLRPGGDLAEPGGAGTSDFNLLNYGSGFRQPYVTWTEPQLIVAEASLATGNVLLSERALNSVRRQEVWGGCERRPPGVRSGCLWRSLQVRVAAACAGDAPQHYRRTCLPYIAAAPATVTDSVPRPGGLPERFPYGQTIAADPNTPNVGPNAHNADSPHMCPSYSFFGNPAAY